MAVRLPGVAARARVVAVEDEAGHPPPALPTSRPEGWASGSLRGVLSAFVLVDAEPGRLAALASELAEIPGVGEVYSVTGKVDLVAVVRVREHDELAEVVTRRISALQGVTATETMVAFQAFSRHDLEAMWSIGLE